MKPTSELLPKPPSALRRIAATVALALVFLVSLVVSALVHVRLPVGRAVLTDAINTALRDVFWGTVRLEGIEYIGLETIGVTGASVLDERGNRLLRVSEVRVFLTLPELIGSLLPSVGERVLQLPAMRAELAEITLSDDAEHGVTLARALTPRPTPVTTPTGRKQTSTTVLLPSIELGRVRAKFELPVLEALIPELAAVRGSVQIAETGVLVDVKRFGVVVGGLAAPMRGTAAVQVNAPTAVDVQLAGFLGESELQASFTWREGAIETRVSSPRLQSATLRRFVPDWPLERPLVLRARANGSLDRLDLTAAVEASSLSQEQTGETSVVRVQGQLRFDDVLSADFATQVSDVSLDLLGPTLPTSSLDAEFSTKLTYGDALEQTTVGTVTATTIADVPVPELTVELTTTARRTELRAVLHEPNAKGELTAVHLPSGDIDVKLDVPRVHLGASRRLPRGLQGVASVQAAGTLREGRLSVDADADVTHFEVLGLRVGRAKMSARTERALAHLDQGVISVTLDAELLAYQQLAFSRANARASLNGETLKAELGLVDDDGRQLAVQGRFNTRTRQLRDVALTARRSDLVAKASVPLLDVDGPVVEIASLDIERTGCTQGKCPKVTGHGRYAPGQLLAKVDAQDVALERLWPVLGLVSPVYGVVNTAIDVELGAGDDRATLSVDATDLSFSGYPKTDVQLRTNLHADRLEGLITAKNALGIVVAGNASATLPGGPLEADSWRGIVGTLVLQGQLESLEPVRLIANVPELQSLDGSAYAKVTAQRLTTTGYPTVSAELDVRNVGAAVVTSPQKPPLTVADHRVYVNATLDTARRTLYASALLEDGVGPLLRLNGQVPVETDGTLTLARQAPLLVNGTLEKRDVGTLPYFDSPVAGLLGGQLTVYGTWDAPEARAQVHLTDLTAAALDDRLPLSIQASAHYALPKGALSSEILGVSGRRSVVLGRAEGTLSPDDLEFRGQARMALDAFPMSVVTPLAALELGGELTGMIEVADTPSPTIDVQLEIDDLTSAGNALGRGLFQAHAGLGRANAHFELEHAKQGVDVVFTATSPAERLPTPLHADSVHARLVAKQLNAAVLSPMMSGIVARLKGELDANITLDWRKNPENGAWSTVSTGLAHLRGGRAYVEGIGLELQDVTLDVVATPLDERTHIAIDRVQARARSEAVNVEGRGQLILRGADVESGSANALFRDVPLTLQGLNLGKATGAASAQMERKESWDQQGPYFGKPYMLVNATLGNWQLRASASASRSLIDSEPHSEIVIAQGERIEERSETLPYRIVLDLGRDTEFSLADFDIPIAGETRVDYTDRAVVSGTLTLKRGGRVPILGHVFEVQSGTLRLNPIQASNPYIDILLSGQAKDGTPVNVTLTGTMQSPIVSPPLGQLNELLGGGAATALSGGVQALGLNALLGDAVQFRVGSADNNQDLARYSAAVQIRERLWFEVNYGRTETNAFRTDNNNAVSGTLDYRFDDNWSLRTEAGTTGGSVDVVWQYRY